MAGVCNMWSWRYNIAMSDCNSNQLGTSSRDLGIEFILTDRADLTLGLEKQLLEDWIST